MSAQGQQVLPPARAPAAAPGGGNPPPDPPVLFTPEQRLQKLRAYVRTPRMLNTQMTPRDLFKDVTVANAVARKFPHKEPTEATATPVAQPPPEHAEAETSVRQFDNTVYPHAARTGQDVNWDEIRRIGNRLIFVLCKHTLSSKILGS